MPRRTLRLGGITSSCSSCPSLLHRISDKNGKSTGTNTGPPRTSEERNYGSVFARGSARLQEKKAGGYGGLAGGDGSALVVSAGEAPTWRRADITTATATASLTADRANEDLAPYKRAEEEKAHIHGVARAAQHQHPT